MGCVFGYTGDQCDFELAKISGLPSDIIFASILMSAVLMVLAFLLCIVPCFYESKESEELLAEQTNNDVNNYEVTEETDNLYQLLLKESLQETQKEEETHQPTSSSSSSDS